MKKLILLSTVVLIANQALATDLLPQESPGFFGRKTRNLGMGNVGVSTRGSAESSAFYNPAGLNDLEKGDGELRFLTITAGISKNSIDLINDVRDLSDDLDSAADDAAEVQVLDEFIGNRSGELQHMRIGVELVSYTRKNFAAGLLFDERLDLAFDASYPHLDIRNLGDAGGYVALSTGFWGKLLQVGMTFKPVVRLALHEEDQRVTYADVTTENDKGDPILKDQFKNIWEDREFAVPVDFGLKSDLAFSGLEDTFFIQTLRPILGLTWEDVGSPSFAPSTTQTQAVNAGFSINPQFARIKTLFAVEMRELNRDRPLLSKLHVGTEVKLPFLLALRAGLSQGYLTGGASLDLRFVRIDAAIYSEEVGFHSRQNGNLRYLASFGFKI